MLKVNECETEGEMKIETNKRELLLLTMNKKSEQKSEGREKILEAWR